MTEIIMNLDWDWFLAQGIWIVATIVVAALGYGALRRWAPRGITALITRITPAGEDWSRASRILNQVVQWAGTVKIVGAMVLVILPRLGVDIAWATDALKDAGVTVLIWLRGHGVRVYPGTGIRRSADCELEIPGLTSRYWVRRGC